MARIRIEALPQPTEDELTAREAMGVLGGGPLTAAGNPFAGNSSKTGAIITTPGGGGGWGGGFGPIVSPGYGYFYNPVFVVPQPVFVPVYPVYGPYYRW